MSDQTYPAEHFGSPPEADGSQQPSPGRSEVLTIGRKKWLIGMWWRSYEVLPEREELSEEAETMHADWVARRVGHEAIQVGFCAQVFPGWPSHVYSLAALLADSHKLPWAGAFELGDGLWWYIAVRDDFGMMPDGDVVGSYEDILRARERHASLEDFNHVNGTREQLEALIEQSLAKRTPVESLTASRFTPKMVLGVAAAIAVAASVYFGYVYYQHDQEQHRLAELRAQIRENAIRALLAATPDVGTLLRSLPDPALWLDACQQAVYSRPLWQCGWQLVSQSCVGTQLVVNWKRGPGATIACRPEGTVSEDGERVSQGVALPLPRGVLGSPAAIPIREARTRLMLWSQAHDIPINISATPVAPKADAMTLAASEAAAALGASMPAPVPSLQIDFSVPAAPFALDFSSIPGLRLNDVSQADVTAAPSDKSNGWKISGVVYGR